MQYVYPNLWLIISFLSLTRHSNSVSCNLSLPLASPPFLFLSLSKDEDWYEQSGEVRSQLKFFEHLERMEKQRKDEQEREILLKAAKVGSQ